MALLKKRLSGGFTQIPNELLYDETISFKEKGLYAYLLSMPDNWNFSAEKIALKSKEETKTIQRYLKILIDAGWIDRERTTAKSGKFDGMDYVIYDTKNKANRPKKSKKKPAKKQPAAGVNTAGAKNTAGEPLIYNVPNHTENNTLSNNTLSSSNDSLHESIEAKTEEEKFLFKNLKKSDAIEIIAKHENDYLKHYIKKSLDKLRTGDVKNFAGFLFTSLKNDLDNFYVTKRQETLKLENKKKRIEEQAAAEEQERKQLEQDRLQTDRQVMEFKKLPEEEQKKRIDAQRKKNSLFKNLSDSMKIVMAAADYAKEIQGGQYATNA